MLELLKQYFGYESFRPLQQEIVEHITKRQNAVVIMPTGGGKSLCFQLPALIFPGLTLVISPLIALMKDQVDTLKANGIAAEYLNSSLLASERSRIETSLLRAEVKILYLAPERFGVEGFTEFLQNLPVSFVAIDEAHCISEWGHDFRPEYRNLRMLRSIFPDTPIAALTATATPKVQEDIIQQLALSEYKVFSSSFNRPNLHYSVLPKKNSLPVLIEYLNKYKDESVIIYCFSRNDTERLTEALNGNGFSALAYHAGLEREKRSETQEKFIRSETNIICATIAFGMGIDKPDVRLVAHMALPKSIESYYQETGRAGRDNLESECVLFFSMGDMVQQGSFIQQIPNPEEQANAWKKLNQVVSYATTLSCRRKYLLNYFDEEFTEPNCGSCDICKNPREEFDATEISQKIISAILRTDSRFGKKYIIDLLLGKSTDRNSASGHDKLSVFGIVTDFARDEIDGLIMSLLAKGLLVQVGDKYPILQVTPAGIQFLKERESILLPKPAVREVTVKTSRGKKTDTPAYADLYENLKELRKQIAYEQEVPPYVIFSNATLLEVTRRLPRSLEEFSRISGVGQVKLTNYGEKFLTIVLEFLQDNPNALPTDAPKGAARQKVQTSSTFEITKTLLEKKYSVEQISLERNIAVGTVLHHIEEMISRDADLDIFHLRPPVERFAEIETAFKKSGGTLLAPVRELLGEDFSYEELRIARLFL